MTNGIKDNTADHTAGQGDPEISIVVPFRDEQETLSTLHAQIKDVMTEAGRSFETIFVDDGSTDESAARVIEIVERDESVSLVQLR